MTYYKRLWARSSALDPRARARTMLANMVPLDEFARTATPAALAAYHLVRAELEALARDPARRTRAVYGRRPIQPRRRTS